MGGIVSTGHNNDDLIDNLLEVDYIKTSSIERVFRAVDRAEYFLPEGRGNAYKDVAWKCGNLHLSAPCIYSEVMEGLCLEPGLSFLNLGSGTGYLSTMIGLILGKNGLNHGIEVYEDVVLYANKKLEEFKKYSGAMDEYDFCEPIFARGNCLCLSETRLYDRVYCGASCPPAFEPYMKNLLKIGGILVVPINEHLMQFKRISETAWTSKTLLPVSFALLVQPPDGSQEMVLPIEIQLPSLQALSRTAIRNILRRNIELELPPPPKKGAPKKAPRKNRVLKRFIVPLFDDDSSDEEAQILFAGRNGLRARATSNNDYENFFSHVIDTLRFRTGSNFSVQQRNAQMGNAETQTTAELRQAADETVEENHNDNAQEEGLNPDPEVAMEEETVENANTTTASMVVNDGSVCSDISCEEQRRDLNLDPSCWAESSESEATNSRKSKTGERKKFDSGLGDENEILEVSEDNDNSNDRDDDIETDDHDNKSYVSTSDEDQSKRTKRSSKQESQSRPKWRRIALEPSFSSSSDTDNEADRNLQGNNEMRMYQSRFSTPMREKIQRLPLPQILKNYLNFYRDF
ncbi:hypothetical protein HHI36_015545 [Cryptolaemus montrouzieri]|uniref:Protein-L-isoaspartate O-methyltransferase domain-containing protein 1 n=1 Tax=Cryptolaemus montrouzieri TaxID=559131 RepID=A0ABD2N5X7_9CUCU